MPSTRRSPARSWSVAMALAVTEKWRVWGTVTPGPTRILEVPGTQAVSGTPSSRQTRCESVIQAGSKPSDPASFTWRTIAGTGWWFMMPISNFTARPLRATRGLQPDWLVRWRPPLRVPRIHAAHQVHVAVRDCPGDRADLAPPHREAVDRGHGRDLVAAAAQEGLVGGVDLGRGGRTDKETIQMGSDE